MDNCFSRCVIVKSGTRQGGILSRLLFNIYIDSLMLGLKSSALGCYMRGLFVGCIAVMDMSSYRPMGACIAYLVTSVGGVCGECWS